MPSDQGVDTSRKAVKTYVPAYQKEAWQEHAERLDMTQSEFVRTMVQAGRRDFSLDDAGGNPTTSDGDDATDMARVVVDVLDEAELLSWDELLDRVTDDVEARLEEVIEELQERNRIRYSGKNGGYTLVER